MERDKDSTWPVSSNIIASLQEGEEWLDRLQREKVLIAGDMVTLEEHLSGVSLAALQYTIDKTNDAIQQIKLEMMLLNE